MASLPDSDRLFVDERRARKRTGLLLMPALLVLIGLIWAALFLWWPLAINPNAVLGMGETSQLCGSGVLTRYALTATVLVNGVLLLLAAFCVVGIARAGRERRYLRIIDRMAQEQALAPPRVPVEASSTVRQ
jgi:hypothetical protein